MIYMLSNQNHGLVLLAKRNTKGQPVRFFSQWGFKKKKKIRNFVLTKKSLFITKHILDNFSSLSKEVRKKNQEILFQFNNQALRIRILYCNENFLYRNIIKAANYLQNFLDFIFFINKIKWIHFPYLVVRIVRRTKIHYTRENALKSYANYIENPPGILNHHLWCWRFTQSHST